MAVGTRWSVVACAVTLAALVAGCGSSSKNAKTSGVRTVEVQITKAGCVPAKLSLPSGPATFHVVNQGADDISEFELRQGNSIAGESENLTPGLSGSFTVTLKPGAYELYCPGGDTGTLTVTGGNAQAQASAASDLAVNTYRTYVQKETEQLVTTTDAFVAAVKAGNVEQAKTLFAPARVHYERIEPVAESFGDLDPEIDARDGDVPADQWGGFHRIEKQLWVSGNTDGMTPVADKLATDVKTLNGKIATLKLEPAQIANGSVDLLNEVGKSKITGEEDRYSHTDLYDLKANVDGSQAAFTALRPMIAAKDANLAEDLDANFAGAQAAIDTLRSGDGFVLYTSLSKDQTRTIAALADSLADELSKTPPLVVA
jgi:iron uptake system component EfeO